MRRVRQKTHVMDEAFTLLLFAVFAVCAMLLVLLGAGVYSRVASGMNEMDAPVILSYVTEKLRGCGIWEQISLGENGELFLKEKIEDQDYVTWIYVEDECLREALLPEGRNPIEGAGTRIAPVLDFKVEMMSKGVLQISVKDQSGTELTRCFAVGAAVDG